MSFHFLLKNNRGKKSKFLKFKGCFPRNKEKHQKKIIHNKHINKIKLIKKNIETIKQSLFFKTKWLFFWEKG